jgi:hypothetical protein
VLDGVDPLGERCRRVAGCDGDGLLDDDWARVHPLVHEVHRNAGLGGPCRERLLDRPHPRESR